MRKLLLTLFCIVGSCFFAYAQFQIGDTKVNVGRVCGTIDGKPACINPSTGQYEFTDGAGGSIRINSNTGAVGIGGSIGGIPIGVGIAGSNSSGGSLTDPTANMSGPLRLLALAQEIINRLVPFLIGLAVVAFFWFLVEFIWKGKDSPEEQNKAKKGIWWSILALFVMVSIWGIVTFLANTLGIDQNAKVHGFTLPGEGQ
jgi:hypothetical protein